MDHDAAMSCVVELAAPVDFDDFYRVHQRRAVALAFVLCGDRSGAEELAHDAFADAYRRWDRVGRYEDPAGWLRRAIANRAVSRWRRRRSEAAALLRLSSLAEPTMAPVEPAAAALWAVVRELPRRQAQVVALHYVEDLSVAEIARLLDMAENTVKVQLMNARRSLAKQMGTEAQR